MEAQDYSQLTDEQLLALCCWREARGEGNLGKRGVAHVIANRAADPKWWGHDMRSVILKPFQFSSFNANDPNSTKWPLDDEADWLDCLEAAQKVLAGGDPDPSEGATYYFSPPLLVAPHAWGPVEVTAKIGRLTFCKPVSGADALTS